MRLETVAPGLAARTEPKLKRTLLFDIECYPNYFLVVFRDAETKAITRFFQSPNKPLDRAGLLYTLRNNRIVGFNSRAYDLPIIQLALDDATCWQLKCASDQLIVEEMRLGEFYDTHGLDWPKFDHIDLFDVAPGMGSLKIYGGRLHCPKMQDLPIDPDEEISADTAQKLFEYCCNDLEVTDLLWTDLAEDIQLREELSKRYGQDLRSRSDAQIAEHVLCAEVEKITGQKVVRPVGLEGTQFQYKVPDYIKYQSPELNAMLEKVRNTWFEINEKGSVDLPDDLAGGFLKVGSEFGFPNYVKTTKDDPKRIKALNQENVLTIGHAKYKMGIGGLHSMETCVRHVADDDYVLIDRDVASYYPAVILTLGLYPEHMGPAFLQVYQSIVKERLEAKRAKQNAKAGSLKIVVNGGFGKLGSKWSRLYSPDLMIQVTLTGQLALLMLIERIEAAGIEVISANTDGVLIKCPRERQDDLQGIITGWEDDTRFETEESRYRAYYAKDVNNYIALKEDGKAKLKGLYANPWTDPKPSRDKFMKNPGTTICIEAAVALLSKGTPIRETIHACQDVKKFIAVRAVKQGGAVKDGEYLGKAIRFYYATDSRGTINYKKSGNKVAKSANSKPLMDLPATLPKDIAYSWYIAETQAILCNIGFAQATLF